MSRKVFIHFQKLIRCLDAPIEWFERFGRVDRHNDGNTSVFIDRGADLLAVAHLDTVQKHGKKSRIDGKKMIVHSPYVDDRLGAYTALHLLPAEGMNFDVLLTTGEESGNSSAKYFEPKKEYNWIFEPDRRGEDVVLYEYSSKEWVKALEDAGFKIGIGTYSDISELQHLKVKAFNMGIGYKKNHSANASADLYIYARQIGRLRKFYAQNHATKYPHKPVKFVYYSDYCCICGMRVKEYTGINDFLTRGILCLECSWDIIVSTSGKKEVENDFFAWAESMGCRPRTYGELPQSQPYLLSMYIEGRIREAGLYAQSKNKQTENVRKVRTYGGGGRYRY